MQEMQILSLGQEDPLKNEMATHSSILAWRIPMGRGALWATAHGSQRVGHDLTNTKAHRQSTSACGIRQFTAPQRRMTVKLKAGNNLVESSQPVLLSHSECLEEM